MAPAAPTAGHRKTFMEKALDVVEVVGNRVPHPAVIFVILIGIVIAVLFFLAAPLINKLMHGVK